MPVLSTLPGLPGICPIPQHKRWASITTSELVAEVEAIGGSANPLNTNSHSELIFKLLGDYDLKLGAWFGNYVTASL
ncbi:hypothetical protein IFR05_005106 [Cadophora sp. M221]|nr:hypothetical protein IFR05_005106 [Cadophora sp. M221]